MPTPTPSTYALSDVLRLTGAKRPQIEYWVRKSLIRGEFEHGTGLPRQFVFRNLVEAATAVDLTGLGLSTEMIASLLDALRYGDIETDVRTAWVVEAPGQFLKRPKLSREERLEAQAYDDATPREERCCADLNDDGTLKLLRLLRAYINEGVSVAEARNGLMAVAREHLRERRRWDRDNEAFHRRWRQFKNPKARPANAQFFLVATLHSSEDQKETWMRCELTDFKQDGVPRERAAVVVPVRQILERLETATNDSWPATAEKRVRHYRGPEHTLSPRQLVDQAFKEYEKAERVRELRAKGLLPRPKEHDHAH